MKQREHTDPDNFRMKVMEELREALGMKELPAHIECFDNSNIQGTNPVASCTVFRNAVPSKKDYRHFKIKTVVGANDFASMKEVVNRRYSRMLTEDPDDLPQLIVIDGGKGQLSAAYEALYELGLTDKLTVIGKEAGRSNPRRGPLSFVSGYELASFKGAQTDQGRGSPLRHHFPQEFAQQGSNRICTECCSGSRAKNRTAASAAFRLSGKDCCGFRGRHCCSCRKGSCCAD